MLGRACRKRETMFDWIVQVIDQLGYAGILLLMLAETMFPPIPSEVIMPIAGVLAVRGEMSLTGIIIRSEEHTSELQSLMRISYAVFCLKKKKQKNNINSTYLLALNNNNV